MINAESLNCLEILVDEETGYVARLVKDDNGLLSGKPGQSGKKIWVAYRMSSSSPEKIASYSIHHTRRSVQVFFRRLRKSRKNKT